ncbi:unnamed protein product, partial [Timema podura]|nr:unnamed protein product [Timema podura]
IAVWFGWILSTFLLISSLYSSNVFYDPNYRYYASDAAVFASLDKLGWSLGSSWIIFACITKNAGPIEKFLTWKPIIPLSRLTYSAFLVKWCCRAAPPWNIESTHICGRYKFGGMEGDDRKDQCICGCWFHDIVQNTLINGAGTLFEPRPSSVCTLHGIKILISHVFVTFLLALVLSIIFESPLNAIQKILLRKDSNLNLPILGSLVQHEASTLANYATENCGKHWNPYSPNISCVDNDELHRDSNRDSFTEVNPD